MQRIINHSTRCGAAQTVELRILDQDSLHIRTSRRTSLELTAHLRTTTKTKQTHTVCSQTLRSYLSSVFTQSRRTCLCCLWPELKHLGTAACVVPAQPCPAPVWSRPARPPSSPQVATSLIPALRLLSSHSSPPLAAPGSRHP